MKKGDTIRFRSVRLSPEVITGQVKMIKKDGTIVVQAKGYNEDCWIDLTPSQVVK